MQLKSFRLFSRLAHANTRIVEVHETWRDLLSGDPMRSILGQAHWMVGEEVAAMLRRAADECVATVWFLEKRLASGQYPTTILVDSVPGEIEKRRPLATRHAWVLQVLRDVANAHKHSFSQTDMMNHVGRDEACLIALAIDHNRLGAGFRPYIVSVDQVVIAFNAFLDDAIEIVVKLGKAVVADEAGTAAR